MVTKTDKQRERESLLIDKSIFSFSHIYLLRYHYVVVIVIVITTSNVYKHDTCDEKMRLNQGCELSTKYIIQLNKIQL